MTNEQSLAERHDHPKPSLGALAKQIYSDIRTTPYDEFRRQETAVMNGRLGLICDDIANYSITRQLSALPNGALGGIEAATSIRSGFLFAHRLIRNAIGSSPQVSASEHEIEQFTRSSKLALTNQERHEQTQTAFISEFADHPDLTEVITGLREPGRTSAMKLLLWYSNDLIVPSQ
jgi:hypothetical protein